MESHRLIACLSSVFSVYKSMLGNSKWYPEGRLHIIPIMNLCLPGLDSNDIRKCLVRYTNSRLRMCCDLDVYFI